MKPSPAPQLSFALVLAVFWAGALSAAYVRRGGPSANLPHRAALFTSDDAEGSACEVVRDALDFYGIRRTEFRVPRAGFPGRLTLRMAIGKPFFGVVVFCAGGLALTNEQWRQLEEFEADFGVRRVSFGADPRSEFGVRPADDAAPDCCEPGVDQRLRWFPQAVLGEAGIGPQIVAVTSESMSTLGLRHSPALVVDRQAAVPFLAFEPLPPAYPNETIAAVVVHQGKSERMSFFFDMAYSATSARLADVWLQWSLRTTKYSGFGELADPLSTAQTGKLLDMSRLAALSKMQSSQDALSPSIAAALLPAALGLASAHQSLCS